MGEYKKAIEWSRRAIDDYPDRYDVWLYLANALANSGSTTEAKQAIANAQRVSPRITSKRYHAIFSRIYGNSEMADGLTDGLASIGFE